MGRQCSGSLFYINSSHCSEKYICTGIAKLRNIKFEKFQSVEHKRLFLFGYQTIKLLLFNILNLIYFSTNQKSFDFIWKNLKLLNLYFLLLNIYVAYTFLFQLPQHHYAQTSQPFKMKYNNQQVLTLKKRSPHPQHTFY